MCGEKMHILVGVVNDRRSYTSMGAVCTWQTSVPSSQLWYKPKTALKITVSLFKKKGT